MSDEMQEEEQEQEEERQRRERETSNLGQLSVEPGGGLVEGIDSGLGIDLKDGGLEVQIAPGISI